MTNYIDSEAEESKDEDELSPQQEDEEEEEDEEGKDDDEETLVEEMKDLIDDSELEEKEYDNDSDIGKRNTGRCMVATQLAREPLVQQCVRTLCFERAKVTVELTKKGIKEIDENHPCYVMKYLKNKPVKDLKGEAFLKLVMAEEDGMLTINMTIDMEGITVSSYVEEVKQLHHRAFARTSSGQVYIKRDIVHPSFHNITYKEAEKLLVTMKQGDVIVTPSSKGADRLTMTWKVANGIYQPIVVREEGKEKAFSLGQSLWIDNEKFEDLDEVIARHVRPMALFARDLISFEYYRDTGGAKKEVMERLLAEEARKQPSKMHYLCSASKEFPGKFMLSYLPQGKCKHEYITTTPEGLRYRQRMFVTMKHLIRYFKEHFRDPIPETPASSGCALSGSQSAAMIIPGQMNKAAKIFDFLYLGSEGNASNLEELQNIGVGHILNVTQEIDNFFPGMFDYMNIRVYDDEGTDLWRHWDSTYKFIEGARHKGSKVLVHCKMGVSRSASVVIAYAMKAYNLNMQDAHQLVKSQRHCIRPNKGFMRQLEDYSLFLKVQKRFSQSRIVSEERVRQWLDADHAKYLDPPAPGSQPKPWSPDDNVANTLFPVVNSDGPNRSANTSEREQASTEDLMNSEPTSKFQVLMRSEDSKSYSVSPNKALHLPLPSERLQHSAEGSLDGEEAHAVQFQIGDDNWPLISDAQNSNETSAQAMEDDGSGGGLVEPVPHNGLTMHRVSSIKDCINELESHANSSSEPKPVLVRRQGDLPENTGLVSNLTNQFECVSKSTPSSPTEENAQPLFAAVPQPEIQGNGPNSVADQTSCTSPSSGLGATRDVE